jgi:hypothetical protein
MNEFTEFTMLKHVRETLSTSTAEAAPHVIGDPTSLLNTKCANWTDVVVVDGKCYDKDAVAKLLVERDALASEVDDANERVADVTAERDALAATLSEIQQASQDYSDGKIQRYEFVKKLAFLAAVTPQQYLAEIRAEAGRAGFDAGFWFARSALGTRPLLSQAAEQYAEKIRQGVK